MWRTWLLIVVVIISVHGNARSSWAAKVGDKTYKVGDKVITTHRANLIINGRAIDTVDRGSLLTVEGVEDTHLWVNSGKLGWLDAIFVVPLTEGVEYFSGAIQEDPKDANAYYCRGKIASSLGDQETAIKDFDKSLEIEPSGSAAYLGRANARMVKKEYDEAIVDYNKALWLSRKMNTDLNVKHALIYNGRATAYLAKGEVDKAMEDYDVALDLDKDDAKIHFNRGNLWKTKEEYSKAIRDYDVALRLDPSYLAAYNNRGTMWFLEKEYDKAIADYDQVLQRDTKNIKARFNRAKVFEAKGKYDQAIADYNTVRLLDPTFADAYSAIARIRASCPNDKYRNGNQGIAFATKACELTNWKNPAHLLALAAAFAEDRQFEAAVKCQTDALDMAPNPQKFEYRQRLNLYKSGQPFHELSNVE